jgi:hypothetical protein
MIYIVTGNPDFFNLLQENNSNIHVIANVLSVPIKEVSVIAESNTTSSGQIRGKEGWILEESPDHDLHPDNYLKSIKLSATCINSTNYYVVTTFNHVYLNAWRAQVRQKVVRNARAVKVSYTPKKKIWDVGIFDIDINGLVSPEFYMGSFEAQYDILNKMVG